MLPVSIGTLLASYPRSVLLHLASYTKVPLFPVCMSFESGYLRKYVTLLMPVPLAVTAGFWLHGYKGTVAVPAPTKPFTSSAITQPNYEDCVGVFGFLALWLGDFCHLLSKCSFLIEALTPQ